PAGILDVWQGISGQYDGKSASRLRAKPSGGLYAVFPLSFHKKSGHIENAPASWIDFNNST
ncbi:hypothetical protein, partial [Ruminococcus sp.]